MTTLIPVLRVLGYLWATPGGIFGLLLSLFLGPYDVSSTDEAVVVHVQRTIPSWAAGQTWGWTVLVKAQRPSRQLLVHEDVHVRQWLVLGPLFPLAYGIASLVAVARGQNYYMGNWFERRAYAVEREFVRNSTS